MSTGNGLMPPLDAAPDGGVLRAGRHALLGPGRLRRDRRHGDRRLAVGLFNQTAEHGSTLTKPGQIGTQYGYVNLRWQPSSPMFDKARATGLRVADWQNVMMVNMIGERFYDETGRQFSANSYKGVDPYVPGSYLNA